MRTTKIHSGYKKYGKWNNFIFSTELTKFLHRIDRHGQKGHGIKQTFTNKSCHEELKEWYESTNLTISSYTKYMSMILKNTLHLPKNNEKIPNPLDEWWLNTGGHFY